MKRLVLGSPVVAAVLLPVVFFIWVIIGGLMAAAGYHFVDPTARVPDWLSITAGNISGGLYMALLVRRLGWWDRVVGTNGLRGIGVPLLVLALLPALLAVFVDSATGGAHREVSVLVVLEFSFVAIVEELLYRGLIFATLVPRGLATAVVLSSLIFGISHLTNAAGFPFPAVAAQVVFASGAGALWAVIRIRSGILWPVIIGHFTGDVIRYALGFSLNDVDPSHLLIQIAYGLALAAVAALLFTRSRSAIGGEGAPSLPDD